MYGAISGLLVSFALSIMFPSMDKISLAIGAICLSIAIWIPSKWVIDKEKK